MTETLTGKQVLALLAQDEPPEIEVETTTSWTPLVVRNWSIDDLRTTGIHFRIKPTPARRLSVTLSNGEVVSWPEPVREASKLKEDQEYWFVDAMGYPMPAIWGGDRIDLLRLAFCNVHLTKEAAQEHADALRKINCQEVGK